MKRALILILPLLIPIIVFCQINGVYVSNIKLENSTEKWCWAFEQDVNNNMLLGVSKGVVVFDGVNQNLISIPFSPSVMKYNKQTEVLWLAGYEQYGYMQINKFGQYDFIKFDAVEGEQFNTIQLVNDSVFFISDKEIVIVDAQSKKVLNKIKAKDENIELAFVYRDKLYFAVDYFIYEIRGEELIEIPNIDFPVDDLSFAIPIGERLLLGSIENSYYMLEGNTYKSDIFKSKSFFKNNVILSGVKYSDNIIILGSLTSGLALVDILNNKIIKEVNYFTGLPDDEIRALFVDNHKGIWVSHEFGISRVDVNQGSENFNFYPGLKGNPIAVQYYQDELYVATSDGLYALEQIKDYKEVSYKIKVPEKKSIIKPEQSNKEVIELSKKDKRKKRRQNKENNPDDKLENDKSSIFSNNKVARQLKTRTIKKRSLKSVSHIYNMVDGINDKCRQLSLAKGYLLAAGNNGLYAVKDKKAQVIIDNVYIHDIYVDSSTDNMFCCTNNGLYELFYSDGKWEYDHFYQTTNENVFSIAKEKKDNWVIAINSKVLRVKLKSNEIVIIHDVNLPEEPGEVFFVKTLLGKAKVFTKDIIYDFTKEGELSIVRDLDDNSYVIENQSEYTFLYDQDNWKLLSDKDNVPAGNTIKALGLGDKVRYISVTNSNELWVIDENNLITKISKVDELFNLDLNVVFNKITLEEEQLELSDDLTLPANMRNLSINMAAPHYLLQNGVQFSYKIDGFDNEWSNWSNSPKVFIQHLPSGKYNLVVKANDELGNTSNEISMTIYVAKPFTETLAFYAIILVTFILLSVFYSKYRLKKLEKDKQILEKKVKERTQTIELQKDKIEKQHSEIKQSIRYAKRIQTAMLPLDEIMEAMLPKHFVLFLPRDIVSGDFYFFKPIGEYIAFVAADCTGHGVPGGFMSMLGISYLSEITSQLSPSTSAAEIINHLREKIKLTLGQTDINSAQKDGMDLSICLIDTETKQLQYSGAFNSLFILRDNELIIIKGDRQPVSVYYNEVEFTNHIIEVQSGDKFYMFSDGYPDQIGGPKGRKFMSKNFKQLIIDIHQKPMLEQKKILHEKIVEWRGDVMQVDDILVVGFEL